MTDSAVVQARATLSRGLEQLAQMRPGRAVGGRVIQTPRSLLCMENHD
jgi:hypothetical protein